MVLGWLRNVLEAHLRFKFYRDLRIMSKQQTFGALITFIERSSIMFQDDANRGQIISNLSLINSVFSWRPHHGDPSPNFATLSINPTTMSVAELVRLIQDT